LARQIGREPAPPAFIRTEHRFHLLENTMLEPEFTLADAFAPVDYATWREAVEKDLKGVPFEKKLVTHTYEGFQIPPVYRREDWEGSGDPSGFPGLFPFTRGSTVLGTSQAGWDIRQEHADPDPAASNRAILADLERGVTSVLLRLDMAARNGQGPDADEAAGLAARDGLMLYDLGAWERVLTGVNLPMAGVALEAGAAFAPAAALLVALARRREDDAGSLRFAFHADPLAALARDGGIPTSLDAAYRDLADLACWTHANLPGSTSVRVGTAPYHHSGATAAQDLGFAMATGVRYLRVLTDAGMSVPDAARQMVFAFGVGTNFFLAIAKLRAARLLWARVLEACGAEDAPGMRMQVRTSRRVMTQRDPWVNILRNTVCCFAGAIAGAETIITEPFDRAIGLPNDLSRRIARNTQVILQEESHLNRVADPAGGCWMLETQTEQLAELAWGVLQEVERRGGMDEALRSGWVTEQIQAAWEPRLKNIAVRKDPITGVSEFPNLLEAPVVREAPDLAALRERALGSLMRADETGREILGRAGLKGAGRIEALVEAAAHGANLGELAAALWADGGEAATVEPIAEHPFAAPFERLRDGSDAFLARTGRRPTVFLANLGPVAHHTARASYAKNFFEAGGFEVQTNPGFGDADAAAAAFRESGSRIAVICSSDKLYETFVDEVAPRLREAGARTVVLAGFPGEREPGYREAGVDRFIYMKCDVLQTLRELLTEEGVIDEGS
jgi:methylmalonyl-CoA mutase